MTALESFMRKRGMVAGVVLTGLIGVCAVAGATPTARTTATLPIYNDVAGQRLVEAAEIRILDQIDDLRRLVAVIDSVADRPVAGADRMRGVTLAFNRMSQITPDGGAAAYDAHLFEAASTVLAEDFNAAIRDLNEDKMDLARATMSLRRIQDALLVGNEEKLASNLADMEGSISRFDSRHIDAPSAKIATERTSSVGVAMDAVKTYVDIERHAIHVELDRQRINVGR